MECAPAHAALGMERTVCADVVALDQTLVYNRFGSFNPFGMIYALRRDVVSAELGPQAFTANVCDTFLGTETGTGAELEAGAVRLKDCKRPRPLVLRANVGDLLHLRLTNLLGEAPGFSETFCRQAGLNETPPFDLGRAYHKLRNWVREGTQSAVDHEEAACLAGSAANDPMAGEGEWPVSRGLNFAIQGLNAVALDGGEAPRACKGLAAIARGDSIDCYYRVEREGPFFMASTAAPSGGEGAGGSITNGLFGAVVGEKRHTRWFRSQVTAGAFDAVWGTGETAPRHARPALDLSLARYDAKDGAIPILDMLRDHGSGAHEIVHADLNAIVFRRGGTHGEETGPTPLTAEEIALCEAKSEPSDGSFCPVNFREFSVFFHDELKTFYTRNFEELGAFGAGQLAGVRDGFAINYGASGMGAMLLANRKGIGPAANCVECLYEEFFLTSWANGDPALLEQYSDDPSNVHHSYLNDAVVFRNFHAGPKETHVFHLHAHQWFAGNDANRGAYLDSQTVAPQQGFSYDIYGGGMQVYHKGEGDLPGWYETLGSGNRNRTVGDSIFHCHLYPHFAQGMWELWRVHDVLEDGTRKLPDGQNEPGLSLAEMSAEARALSRPGSVDAAGRWVAGAGVEVGTPVPALVPLPDMTWPLLPSYAGETSIEAALDEADTDEPVTTMPGFPFYIGGDEGHRPPQAPNDIARALDGETVTDEFLDGGLPRHTMQNRLASGDFTAERSLPFDVPAGALLPMSGGIETLADAEDDAALLAREAVQSQLVAKALAMGDMTLHLEKAPLTLLPYDGTPLERAAMAFHHDGTGLSLLDARGDPAAYDGVQGGYRSLGPSGAAGIFAVNGAPAKPGAPFADPCGAPDALATVTRLPGVADVTPASYVIGPDNLAVLWSEPGTAPTAADPQRPASDIEVSNWVEYQRPDFYPLGRPVLYTVEDGTAAVIEAAIVVRGPDPFLGGEPAPFTTEPAVVGFRRYEASAVQLDLVTNRAGWHDPQARINVLTAKSPDYKEGSTRLAAARISPTVSHEEEPFFFRALSGECIEFRHTNELPKDLELDDFQVKTPTDTVGQHIHLVKFDVTSSDGSGNGWNYEDGTLAADEIAARICAAKNAGMATTATRAAGELALREAPGLCVEETPGHWVVAEDFHDIWRRSIEGENRKLFQTTVQRWFADPILSDVRLSGDEGGYGDGLADRTLRTVFSHDHFGPSSIQQHGFYTALVIEPQKSQTCDAADDTDCTDARLTRDLIAASDLDVGATKLIVDPHEIGLSGGGTDAIAEASYREFALAVADFALLYDPRHSTTPAALDAAFPDLETDTAPETLAAEAPSEVKGLATLWCEAKYATASPPQPVNMATYCGSVLKSDAGVIHAPAGDVPPAWFAQGRPGDEAAHQAGLAALMTPADSDALRAHLVRYRQMAAGWPGDDPAHPMADPVAGPKRPESISVDHHDPYLVNYRGEPIPLRVGESASAGDDCTLRPLQDWTDDLSVAGGGVTAHCSLDRQKPGEPGDMANAFVSDVHDDPATPILDAYDKERVLVRLVQGAQEVQHTYNLEGYSWPRNIDQHFPTGAQPFEDVTPATTLRAACADWTKSASPVEIGDTGRPDQYPRWYGLGPGGFSNLLDQEHWEQVEDYFAECFNGMGLVTAQEVGISEHFEFRGAYRKDSTLAGWQAMMLRLADESPATDADEIARLAIGLGRREAEVVSHSDTLMHFGSVDALWNGAWGLLRVWESEDVKRAAEALVAQLRTARRDLELALQRGMPLDSINVQAIERLLRVEPEGPLVSQRLDLDALRPIGDLTGTLGGRVVRPGPDIDLLAVDGVRPLPDAVDRALRQRVLPPLLRDNFLPPLVPVLPEPEPAPPVSRVAQCDRLSPFVHAAIVAIEAETVFGKATETGRAGTSYSRRLYDPNGLFIALVDPRRLLNFDAPHLVTADTIADVNSWTSIPLGRIVDTIRLTYDRPEPLVLTVNAGDCVQLTILNALVGRGADRRLADAMGDAEMPRIVPLNVEPRWSAAPVNPAIGASAPLGNEPLTYTQESTINLQPSSRFALSLPLPVFNEMQSYGRPFGRNGTLALAGIGSTADTETLSIYDFPSPEGYRTAQIEKIEFYAGLAVARDESVLNFDAVVISDLSTLENAIPRVILDQPEVREELGRFAGIVDRYRAETEAVIQRLAPRLELAPPPTLSSLARAGRARASDLTPAGDAPVLRAVDGRTLGVVLGDTLRTADEGGTLTPQLVQDVGQAEFRLDLLRRDLELNLLREKQRPEAQALRRFLETVRVHYVPYAFGALPMKSFGDIIGHPLHGLIGAVTVVPESARLEIARVSKVRIGTSRPFCFVIDPQLFGGVGQRVPRTPCNTFVLVPQQVDTVAHPLWAGSFTTTRPDARPHRVRQFTLFWQDGLNQHELPVKRSPLAGQFELAERLRTRPLPDLRPDPFRPDLIRPERLVPSDRLRPDILFRPTLAAAQDRHLGLTEKGKQVADCLICDDSYDKGDKGISYRSEPFHIRLRGTGTVPPILESHMDLNAYDFGPDFFPLKPGEMTALRLPPMPVLRVGAGEEVVIHVVHPGGRARQRSFATIAQDYDDLFPGFGFPRSALLGPGKAIRASLTRPLEAGCYLFFDGPTHLRAGGTWGLIDVVAPDSVDDLAVTACARGATR